MIRHTVDQGSMVECVRVCTQKCVRVRVHPEVCQGVHPEVRMEKSILSTMHVYNVCTMYSLHAGATGQGRPCPCCHARACVHIIYPSHLVTKCMYTLSKACPPRRLSPSIPNTPGRLLALPISEEEFFLFKGIKSEIFQTTCRPTCSPVPLVA